MLGPKYLLETVANALELAHFISSCYCRWYHLGPIILQEVLLMPLDGPITLAAADANSFALAHYCFCAYFGLLCMAACDSQLLPASSSPWPRYFTGRCSERSRLGTSPLQQVP